MNAGWNIFEENSPPEEVILLVNGPLGLDLAVKLEDNLYFKKGDAWTPENLEHWRYNIPTHWAELILPPSGKISFTNDNPAPPVMENAGRLTHACV